MKLLERSLARPPWTIAYLGVAFYGVINLLFKFHLIADDFSYQQAYWAHANHSTLLDVVPLGMALRQPIYILQYGLICLSPHSTNLYYFLFQLVHVFNSVLVFRLVQKLVEPYLTPADRVGSSVAFLSALFFLFFPNNFEILFWRSCLFYSLGLTLVLIGTIWFSSWSLVLWLGSFLIYESFFFFPLIMLVPFMAKRESPVPIKKFFLVYGAALFLYGMQRIVTTYVWHAEFARYPLDIGFAGSHVLARILGYLYFHLGIRSSQKDYELLSWLFRIIVVAAAVFNRNWIRENRKITLAVISVYLLLLVPVSLIAHPAPRGSFSASVLFCVLLALILDRSPRVVPSLVIALFLVGQVLAAQKADTNSKIYARRYDEIKAAVLEYSGPQTMCVEVKNFQQGFRKEWFLQAGFSLAVIENELRAEFPDRHFDLKEDCSGTAMSRKIDFLTINS